MARQGLAVSPAVPTPAATRPATVGRGSELEGLFAAFEAVSSGRGLMLCVTGEPGVGKTTLVEDFLAGLGAGGNPFHLAKARCSERLAGTDAYLPFLEALDTLLMGADGAAAVRVMKIMAPAWYVRLVPHAATPPARLETSSRWDWCCTNWRRGNIHSRGNRSWACCTASRYKRRCHPRIITRRFPPCWTRSSRRCSPKSRDSGHLRRRWRRH